MKSEVGDIELVLIPKMGPDPESLFGSEENTYNLALEKVNKLVAAGILEKRSFDDGLFRWGQRTQYARHVESGIAVDIFQQLPPAQFGVNFAIRTGSAEFTRLLVTQKSKGGYLSDRAFVRDGGVYDTRYVPGGELVPMPEEIDLFDFIGLPFVPPECRS
jgi:DNA polymerase/3'-5' exonuclease PolX